MPLIDIGRKAAVYGFRHLVQSVDYHLLRGLAAPEKVAITVEVIHGSKKSEAKFMEDKDNKDAKPEGKQQ